MSDDDSDNDRIAELIDTLDDETTGYNTVIMGQIGSGISYPKDAADSDSDDPDREGEGGSSL